MGRVAALSPINGTIIWETRLKASANLSAAVTLHIEKEQVYAGCQGHVFCLDKQDGHILWHNGLKGWGFGLIAMGSDSHVSNPTKQPDGFSSY